MLTMMALAALPIVVLMLLLGSVAKLAALGRDARPEGLAQIGPIMLVPERWRRAALIVCGVAEVGYAAALILWDFPLPRWGVTVFFALAGYVLLDLRHRRPEAGCGCFGEVSTTPVGLRSIGRTAVLGAMAALLAVRPVDGFDLAAGISWTVLAWMGAGLLLVLALSPEVGEAVARLRHRAPCEQREPPADEAFSRLMSSAAWRARRPLLASTEPADTWRELCWRFFAYEGRTADGDDVDVIFAVYLSGGRHAPVRSVLIAADGTSLESLPESIVVSA